MKLTNPVSEHIRHGRRNLPRVPIPLSVSSPAPTNWGGHWGQPVDPAPSREKRPGHLLPLVRYGLVTGRPVDYPSPEWDNPAPVSSRTSRDDWSRLHFPSRRTEATRPLVPNPSNQLLSLYHVRESHTKHVNCERSGAPKQRHITGPDHVPSLITVITINRAPHRAPRK